MLLCEPIKIDTPFVQSSPNPDWIDLPDVGLLNSADADRVLKREIRRSPVMRAEVSISAARQAMLHLAQEYGVMVPADEVLRIISVVANAL